LGTFVLIPAEWHRPLRQRMVLMRSAGDTAKAFYEYLLAPAARGIFRKFGFVLPDDVQ
jgi:molybdate transport system substrate-binding protein